MLKRYQAWTIAYPLLDWLLSVVLGLALFLGLFFVIPGPRAPGFAMLLVILVLSPPTRSLLRRFSDATRQVHPIAPSQEIGVGILSILAFVLSISAFGACILGHRVGWSTNRGVELLMVFSMSALLSLGLGQAARYTAAGRWGTRLTLGWLVVILAGALVGTLRRAFMHL